MKKIVTKQGILYSLAGIILIILFFFIIFGDRGLIDLYHLKNKRDLLVEQNEKLAREIEDLKRFVDRLEKEDPELIERIARDELKMIGKDEFIYLKKHPEKP